MLGIIKRRFWIRGAISFKEDNKIEIEKATIKFIKSFLEINKIKPKDILLIMIVAPKNLHSSYPCTFLRENGYDFPCITFSDIEVLGTPQNIIRFVINCKSMKKVKDLYLDDASKLRDILLNT
jgi:monofunctional chorismate mutase